MNKLINESSPYLLQHAHNPIEWYPWGAEALEKAKRENKLIVVSIGYSACHWCHVMEKESFEDQEVAEVMNALYVNIKVDREERPDIDQIYMSALQLMNGTGGWPLNCILLPDQRPIYGGTYFKKKDWINILSNIAAMHRNKPQELLDYADKLIEGVRKMELVQNKASEHKVDEQEIQDLYTNWRRFLDFDFGGTQGAPKFPVPVNISNLLKHTKYYPSDQIDYYLQNTLHRIARGGIYDQIAGGIYRYSVDAYWKIPHFEKMLYDQSQTISLYADAYRNYKHDLYLKTFQSNIQFCLNELKNTSDGGYYSALDADSEGVEGKYYCWTVNEIKQYLGDDADLYIEYYQMTEEGNFEHHLNNLFAVQETHEIKEKYQLTDSDIEQKILAANTKLAQIRKSRVRPGLDDKQLCAWNALMIKALCDAYIAEPKQMYLDEAVNCYNFIHNNLLDGQQLYRSYKNKQVKINAFLDDYAFYIEALLKLFELTADESYVKEADLLIKHCIKNFMDDQSGMFWYRSLNDEELVARKQEFYDSVIPSSNSVMMNNLYKMSIITGNMEYEEIADNMVFTMKDQIKKYPPSYSNFSNALLMKSEQTVDIVITGKNAKAIYLEINKNYLANTNVFYTEHPSELSIFKSRYVEGKDLIYVCIDKSCHLPTESVADALSQLPLK
jgi:uncharacterized protein YyaL (SSP411 family)